MILGIQSQTWHTVLAQSAKSNTTTPATNNTVVTVTPSQSTNKTFWIGTVHLDGTTSIQGGLPCGNSARILHRIQPRSFQYQPGPGLDQTTHKVGLGI